MLPRRVFCRRATVRIRLSCNSTSRSPCLQCCVKGPERGQTLSGWSGDTDRQVLVPVLQYSVWSFSKEDHRCRVRSVTVGSLLTPGSAMRDKSIMVQQCPAVGPSEQPKAARAAIHVAARCC